MNVDTSLTNFMVIIKTFLEFKFTYSMHSFMHIFLHLNNIIVFQNKLFKTYTFNFFLVYNDLSFSTTFPFVASPSPTSFSCHAFAFSNEKKIIK